ncbi:MAG: hypothetical protein TR69_WS6001000029 [candidate division WS6 bacterium OLB20]|uniref:Smf/DprA SLOG domain-containing protein n=1 Tax=candidate division WS6 bacterium OLB20 TaxID=1617426 RepID=A0A136M112_9BACT|nr:MAG: hypothetical protein TR69_WS6001000029 [candidate division WS6 bacterium OLB20]
MENPIRPPEQILNPQTLFLRNLPASYRADGRTVRAKPLPDRLFISGELLENDMHPVAIIGSRDVTIEGRNFAFQLGAGLALQGRTVVSGLALGSDTAALQGTLSKAGRAIAVLPGPLDDIRPKTNLSTARVISQMGALLSEYPSGTPYHKRLYIERNRLIVAMCSHLVIVEAKKGGGTHQAAQLAYAAGVPVSVFYNEDNQTETAYLQQAARVLDSNMLSPVYSVTEVLHAVST